MKLIITIIILLLLQGCAYLKEPPRTHKSIYNIYEQEWEYKEAEIDK
jgi:hypothetical protein